jgi:hypothetical protein
MASMVSRVSAAILCGSVVFGLAACTQTGQDGKFESPTGADSTSSDPQQGTPTQQLPLTAGNGDTGASAEADPTRSQTLYLWEEGNVPATTVYTQNTAGYADDPDFRPSLTSVPVPAGTPVKGAVLINAGSAFRVRSNQVEASLLHCSSVVSVTSPSWSTTGSAPTRRRRVRSISRARSASSGRAPTSTALTATTLPSWAFRQAASGRGNAAQLRRDGRRDRP